MDQPEGCCFRVRDQSAQTAVQTLVYIHSSCLKH